MESSRCLVVMYHYVRDRASTREAGICGLSVADFERQLDELIRHLDPIDWASLRAGLERGAYLPKNAFLLTFDDGLSDHIEVVAPILSRRGLRAVFFVQAEVLDGGKMAVVHQIHLLCCALGDAGFVAAVREWLARRASMSDRADRLDPIAAERIYHYEPPHRAHFKYLLSHGLPAALRDRMIGELFERHVGESYEWARRWYMNAEQIRRLHAQGHTIGGHGYRHEFYTRMSEVDQCRDIERGATVLNEILGTAPRPFSYPYGSWTRAAAQACARAGFVHAFGTNAGWVRRDVNLHRIPRVDTIAISPILDELAAQRQVAEQPVGVTA